MFLIFFIGIMGLALTIFVHELGHYCMARALKVKVKVFALGFGPKIVSWKKSGTEYRINYLLVGGYCRLDDGRFLEILKKQQSRTQLKAHTLWKLHPLARVMIALSGPLANFFLAIFLFTIIFALGYSKIQFSNQVMIPYSHSLAYQAGLRTGDQIIKIDGHHTADFDQIQDQIKEHKKDKSFQVSVQRQGKTYVFRLPNVLSESSLGIAASMKAILSQVGLLEHIAGFQADDQILTINGKTVSNTEMMQKYLQAGNPKAFDVQVLRKGKILDLKVFGLNKMSFHYRLPRVWISGDSLVSSLSKAFEKGQAMVKANYQIFWYLLSGQKKMIGQVSGPISVGYWLGEGTLGHWKQSWWQGIEFFMIFLALINIALCCINLLPIPLLDGGNIVLYLVDWLSSKRINYRFFVGYLYIGLVFFVFLFMMGFYSDWQHLANENGLSVISKR